jgi:hypothetical protein
MLKIRQSPTYLVGKVLLLLKIFFFNDLALIFEVLTLTLRALADKVESWHANFFANT